MPAGTIFIRSPDRDGVCPEAGTGAERNRKADLSAGRGESQGREASHRQRALEGVQAIFGMHNKPDLPVGTIGIKEGPLMAAADGFVVEVAGRGPMRPCRKRALTRS